REEFEARFEQKLFAERIADLHRRPVLFRLLGQIARRERRARESVATRLGADVENRITDTLRRTARDLFMTQHSETEDVHERIALVAFVKISFAADRGNADAVAVM